MRKLFLSLMAVVFLLCLLIPAALAETQAEFEQGCWVKTRSSATVYQLDNPEGGLVVGGKNNFTAVGSIAAGAYVRINSSLDADGMDLVTYWSAGNRAKGYIQSSVITSATMTVRFDDGTTASVPEAYAYDRTALIAYLNASSGTAQYSAIPGSDIIHVERKGGSGQDYMQTVLRDAPDPDTCTFEYAGAPVQAVRLGRIESVIRVDGEERSVPTQALTWTSSAPAGQRLATITAPKTGTASLRNKASGKGAVISKLPTGTTVAVVKIGKSYARVWCDGVVGFILTTALTYHENKLPEGVMEGVVTFNGRTNSKNEINVRAANKNGSRILGAYRAGTPVMIMSQDSTWTEIEVNGQHCYILTKYVTTIGPYEPSELEAADTADAPADDGADEPAEEPEETPDEQPEDEPAHEDGDEPFDESEYEGPAQVGTPLPEETDFGYGFDSEIEGDGLGS